MFYNKYLNSFVITLLMAVCLQAYSVSQIGDIRIEKSDDKWLCDMIECPLTSDRCFVSKSNEEPSVLKRINICYSKDNKILAQEVSSTSTDPKNYIREYINSYHNGVLSTTSDASASNFDEKAFNEEMKRQMKNLQLNLSEMHKGIDRNIQNEMQKLDKSLSNLQYKLKHMFH